MPTDQPGGRPPSAQASVRPHREHARVNTGFFALAGAFLLPTRLSLAGARFEDFGRFFGELFEVLFGATELP